MVKLLRYNNHICYVNNINALFKAFRFTTCDKIFSKTGNLEQHLVTCSDRVNNTYRENVYELRETLFEKLDAFITPYRNEQKLFRNLAIFDFESICVKEDSYKQTETTTWIRKHVLMSVSISSNSIHEPISLCNTNPRHLISSFITALEGIAFHSQAHMKLNFIEIETAIKIKLCAILEQLNQRRNRAERVSSFVDDCILEDEEKDISTQFLQMQKTQLIDLQLIDIEPTVMKKAIQFDCSKFGDIHILENMNFLVGASRLDSFLKAHTTKDTKGFFPYA